MKTKLITLLFTALSFSGRANSDILQQSFIDSYAYLAVEEMQRSGIPASIKMAQAVLESNWGKGRTAVAGNNFFCIKCYNGWQGDTLMVWDDEVKESCFRAYSNYVESFRDHSNFLRGQPRYRGLFQNSTTDYKNWARGLKESGYATDKDYAQKLITIIESYGLYIFDYAMPAKIQVLETQNQRLDGKAGYRISNSTNEGVTFQNSNFSSAENEALLSAPVYKIGGSVSNPAKKSSELPTSSWENPIPILNAQGSGKIRVIQPLPESG